MKAVMATHYFPSHHGGIEMVADRIFRAFAQKGHEIVWIAGEPTPPPARIGVSHAVGLSVLNLIENRLGVPVPIPTFSALKLIRNVVSQTDIVLLHDCLYLTNIAAFLCAKLHKIPIVLVQHVGLLPYENWILRCLMKLANLVVTRHMLRRADQVVFIGEATKFHFRNLRFKSPPELVFNGVDGDLYWPVESIGEKMALRIKYRLPLGHPVILFVGRLVESKGLAILKKMAKERPDWTWVLSGRPGPVDPNSWNAANVHVFFGPPDATLAEIYRASDLFVLPSRYEAFSIVVREALISGLPVVCTSDVLKSDPEIEPYIQGLPIYPDDDERTAAEFIRRIETSLASEARSATKSRERHDFAAQRYSWLVATDRYARILSRLAAGRRQAKPVEV